MAYASTRIITAYYKAIWDHCITQHPILVSIIAVSVSWLYEKPVNDCDSINQLSLSMGQWPYHYFHSISYKYRTITTSTATTTTDTTTTTTIILIAMVERSRHHDFEIQSMYGVYVG